MINYVIPVFISLALLAFMITGFRLIWEAGNTKRRNARKNALLWSVIAFFVLISIWGLVNILLDTFFPNTSYSGAKGANTYRDADYWETAEYPVDLNQN